jgi:hypothetical protein
MATPSEFPQANLTLKPAPGTEDTVVPLRVYAPPEQDFVLSCWQLSADELKMVQETGKVWLVVYGPTSYPVAIYGGDPFNPVPGKD